MRTEEFTLWFRFEAAVVLIASLVCFHAHHGDWGWFAALFLLPDVSMLGYLYGKQVGAHCYNLAHSYAVAGVVIVGVFWFTGGIIHPLWWVWPAHIAFDRMMGYGLKSVAGFHHTHLGAIGPAKS